MVSYRKGDKRGEINGSGRPKIGRKTITVFEFDENSMNKLNVLIFYKADEDWLKYAANNRRKENAADDYDIVAGPVANDRTAPVIAAYFSGIYDEAETIKRLLPQRLKDQYAFKTTNALNYLTFCEVIEND